MSSVTKTFQISIYGLMCLSSFMLMLAEGTTFPQGLTIPLAVAAYYFTERRGTIRLSPLVAFFLGVIAFLLAGSELLSDDIESRILAGTHLLVYLSWIVLFQAKELQNYWWMSVLSVLQVAIGAVLTNDATYGLLLVMYLFAAFWTLAVLTLRQAQSRFVVVSDSTAAPNTFALAVAPLSDVPASVGYGVRPAHDRSLRMSNLLQVSSSAQGAMFHDPHESWITWRFAGGIFLAGLVSMSISVCFFLLVPRVWIGRTPITPDAALQAPPMTGFSEEVRLGEIGDILESTARVLELEVFDTETGEKLNVLGYASALGYDEPLLRGMVLDTYDRGGWTAELGRDHSSFGELDSSSSEGSVRQEIRLEPTGSSVIFAIPLVIAGRISNVDAPIFRHHQTAVLVRPRAASISNQIAYTVYTPKPPSRPSLTRSTGFVSVMRTFGWVEPKMPPNLDRLAALAREVAGMTVEGNPPTHVERAKRLEAYLRDSGEFSYTLKASIVDPSLDPVEDFLFNRKEGHCEYYASALALMLRAVGIQSRLVNGFKGGDWNESTKVLEVQERHAHAWVEALIGRNWVVLDATPAARSESVKSLASTYSTWSEILSTAEGLWTSLVNMNLAEQRQLVYAPLRTIGENWWASLKDERASLARILEDVKEFLQSPRRWFSWQGGLATFVLLALLCMVVLLFKFSKSLWRAVWSLLFGRAANRRADIEFYERFRALCKSRGLVRGKAQTQREFGETVHRSLNEVLRSAGLADFPRSLIDSFYQVRFGSRPLNELQVAEIDLRLSELEHALAERNGHHAKQKGAPQHA